jgi:hypothetical protein
MDQKVECFHKLFFRAGCTFHLRRVNEQANIVQGDVTSGNLQR